MKLTVANFQSLGSVSLTVAGLTVLVGPSNRGKSALVRALEAALFNKPGDEFIRTGAKRAEVTVHGLPSVAGAPLDAAWVKGGGKTVYTVDGQTYSKVGQGTPPALVEAGYRDIWIGDKERKKGEWLRPQVSAQHDPIFLLNRPGSFISDVLGAISRHAVLLTAQGRATSDQRSAKQQHGFKQVELATAAAQLQALDGVPALEVRVAALQAREVEVQALRARVARLKALLASRALLAPVAALRRPLVEHWPAEWLEGRLAALNGLRALVAARPARLALGGAEATTRTAVPLDLGDRERWLRGLLPAWRAIQGVHGARLPAPTELGDLEARALARAKAVGLTPHRERLVRLLSRPPSRRVGDFEPPLDATLRMRADMADLVARQAAAVDTFQRCEAALSGVESEVAEAEAALSSAMAALTVCPTCERPF